MWELLKGLLFGGGGAAGAVTGVAKIAGLATLAPLAWRWFEGHGQVVVLTLNVSQALFVGGLVFALVQVAHGARTS